MGKFKVYIIDEAHQFGMPSWSALLKTIEEPPPFVVFIFCTTDFSDIPETIRSRCQCVEFNAIEAQPITDKLAKICAVISFDIDKTSLRFIAERAGGNMRTAENLLEQNLYTQPAAQPLELAFA
jgi:DNA polymerase III subunit gamma/tau